MRRLRDVGDRITAAEPHRDDHALLRWQVRDRVTNVECDAIPRLDLIPVETSPCHPFPPRGPLSVEQVSYRHRPDPCGRTCATADVTPSAECLDERFLNRLLGTVSER